MKAPTPQIRPAQALQVEPGVMGATEEQQPKLTLSSSRIPFVSPKPHQVHVPEQAQIIGPQMSPQLSMASLTSEQAQTLSGPLTHEHTIELKTAFTAGQEQELGAKLMVPRILKPTQTQKESLIS